MDLNTVKPKPFKWITDMTWLNLVALSSLNQFASILDQVVSNERGWRQWTDKTSPELENIPDGYQSNLDTFRRLLIIRAWCPDRITNQANIYVGDCLGRKFAEGFVLDLDGVYHESTPLWPIVGLLSTGSDPTTQIELLAKKYRVSLFTFITICLVVIIIAIRHTEHTSVCSAVLYNCNDHHYLQDVKMISCKGIVELSTFYHEPIVAFENHGSNVRIILRPKTP